MESIKILFVIFVVLFVGSLSLFITSIIKFDRLKNIEEKLKNNPEAKMKSPLGRKIKSDYKYFLATDNNKYKILKKINGKKNSSCIDIIQNDNADPVKIEIKNLNSKQKWKQYISNNTCYNYKYEDYLYNNNNNEEYKANVENLFYKKESTWITCLWISGIAVLFFFIIIAMMIKKNN